MTTATLAPPVSVSPVPKLWPGETVVILGGGPSLTPSDVAYCRGKARVIGVKEAAVCSLPGRVAPAPWADVLYAADEKWWRFEKGAPGFAGMKYSIEDFPVGHRSRHEAALAARRDAWPDVVLLKNTGCDGLERDPAGLRTGYNSGYQAINLAVHLGAATIVLLGFDMWRGPTGEQNWFGPHPNHVDSPYPIFLQLFASLIEPLKLAGVQMVNASRFTVLNAFQRVNLQDALP